MCQVYYMMLDLKGYIESCLYIYGQNNTCSFMTNGTNIRKKMPQNCSETQIIVKQQKYIIKTFVLHIHCTNKNCGKRTMFFIWFHDNSVTFFFFLPHVDALCLLNAIKYRYLWNCTSWIGLLIYNRFRVALNCGFDVKSVFVSIPLFCSESRNILISGGISAVVWNPTNYPFVLFTLDCIFICLKNWLCYFPSFSESILFRSVL